MISTPKGKSHLFLASSLRDGLEDNDIKQVTTLLTSKEADPNVLLPNYGISPFHLVIGNESEKFAEEVTKLFLRHGGNPNVKAIDGMTPVHVAAAWGRVKVLELLLANGGDPLCLDDDGRSPFHYAFDGAYYDAITMLGKYCEKDQDDDQDDNDSDEPKVQIKLEKIFVNNGNFIAEYVSPDLEETDGTEVRENIQNIKVENCNQIINLNNKSNSSSSPTSSLPSTKENTNIINENVKLNVANINFRRNRAVNTKKSNAISPILPLEEFNFDSQSRSESEEKMLVGKIIKRLSTSFNKPDKPRDIEQNILRDKEIPNKLTSHIRQPKVYKNNLKSMEKKMSPMILDTSIVSKSPNLLIPLAKSSNTRTPGSRENERKKFVIEHFNDAASKSPSPIQTKSASSTPRRRIGRISHGSQGKTSIENNNIQLSRSRNSLNQTYSESDYDIPYSPQSEKKSKIINRIMSKNVIRKLDGSINDDDYGLNINKNNNKVVKKIKSKEIKKKIDTKKILGIDKAKMNNNSLNKAADSKIMRPPNVSKIPKAKIKSPSKSIKENNFKYLESPGSSSAVSINSAYKSNLNAQEEMILLNELDEIYNSKGQTPSASISRIANDSLNDLENSLNESENKENLLSTISTNINETENTYHTLTQGQSSCVNSDIFRTPMIRSFMSSKCSNESFVSVDEEYAYVDTEKNVAFLERRLRVIPNVGDMDKVKQESTWLDRLAELSINSCGIASKQSSKVGSEIIGNNTLRNKLMCLGDIPGPVTNSTYNVYLKRLRRLEQQKQTNVKNEVPKTHELSRISKIPKKILSTEWTNSIEYYQNLEDQVFREYQKPKSSKKYRGGVGTSSFNYILLDPRITEDLPRTGRNLHQNERWKRFLEAIFYIGKGKAARPAAHLYEAFDIWTGKKQVDEPSQKIQRIIDIWRDNRGVICLHVFMNTMQEEAFNREAAMIDALGTNHLSNCIPGNYYGILSTMNHHEKRALGKYLLYKAMEIFMFEGERQIFPRSIL